MIKRSKHNNTKHKALIGLPLISIVLIGLLYFFADLFRPSWNYDWVGIRKPIKNAVISVEENPKLNFKYPASLSKREWIINNASQAELLKLINYPDASIRAIAYEGLLRQGYPESDPFNFAIAVIHDHKEPFTFYDTLEGEKRYYTVTEYIIDEILMLDVGLYPHPPSGPPQIKLSFTDDEIKVIDSLYTVVTFRYE